MCIRDRHVAVRPQQPDRAGPRAEALLQVAVRVAPGAGRRSVDGDGLQRPGALPGGRRERMQVAGGSGVGGAGQQHEALAEAGAEVARRRVGIGQQQVGRCLLYTSTLREPRSYLATIARGLLIDLWRRRALEQAYLQVLESLPEAHHPSLEEQALVMERLVRLDRMLDGLGRKVKAAFLMAMIEGASYPCLLYTSRCV